jgi:hypothetical protein
VAGILESFFGDQLPSVAQEGDPFYAQFGLDRNPFPPNRMIVAEVLYNQEEAFGKFRAITREIFSSSAPERRALAVVAGTGGGKTHFLRHCQYIFQIVCAELERTYAIVEFVTGSGKVDDLVRTIYEGCDEACRRRHEMDLPTALARKLAQSTDGAEIISSLPLDDVRRSLNSLVEALRENFSPRDSKGHFDFDTLRDLFSRWLRGETLSQTERKYLGVFSRISTPSLAVRVLRETLTLSRRLGLVQGVFLCLDEIESLFTRGLNLGKVQAFLQDLRYLYDESLKGQAGYDLMILSASTTTGADVLKDRSYPVYQRLTYEGRNRVSLSQIRGVSDANNFAQKYVDFFHEQWEVRHPGQQRLSPRSLLSLEDIEVAFKEASSGGVSAPQGPLLDVLHRKVEERKRVELMTL